MELKKQISILIMFVLLTLPTVSLAQTINFGTAAKFCIFTASGAIANTGTSAIKGDMGTNIGAISGFETSSNSGNQYNADSVSRQTCVDLVNAYNQLVVIPATNTTHTPTFGTNELPLIPGVYTINGAASIGGTLTLDGRGNVNSVFIFRINGAFSTGASSAIVLTNGASACNVYWVAEGAVAMAASTVMKGTVIAHNGANSMGANCTLEGRIFSTSGAIALNNVQAYLPCSGWLGSISTDWNTAGNWVNTVIPTKATNIIIYAHSIFSPILNSGTGKVQNITIQNGATLTITGGKLQVAGTIINYGTFDASIGSLEMNGSSAQTIPVNTFANNNLRNFIVSNNVTLSGQQNLTGTLSFGSSNVTLSTGDFLTLKSTANGTARVADITNGNYLTNTAINGKITVERYVSAKRAWRLLSIPISSIGAPTINNSWQEGVGGNSASDPNPGYGTHITGGSISNGFDQGVNNNASIKIFDNATNSLIGLSVSSNTNIPITTYPAYFLFLRGSRNTPLSQGSSAPLSATTLRIKGKINTGNIPVNINASNTTLVGNPYPCAIDFHSLIKENVNDIFYVWDPKLNGSSGVGGYVTFIGTGLGQYISTTSVSPESQYIQSGEAFFVQTDGIRSGTLTFTEAAKTLGGNDAVFRQMTDNTNKLRVNLLAINTGQAASLCDGIVTVYNDNNSNSIDNRDAKKLYNAAENIAIGREGINLAIESRKTIDSNDTTFINLYTLKKQQYKLEITTEGINKTGLHALIKDKYLGIQKDTALNMDGITDVFFTVNNDAASYAVNRFSIVFRQDVVLPVKFLSVKAHRLLKDIVIEWKTENEVQVKNYEVETSADGIVFIKAYSIDAKVNNGGGQTYFWTDKYIADGLHYYRIKSIDFDGKCSYSAVVNEVINKGLNKKYIVVYDNIVKGNQISLGLYNIDKGNYVLKIISMDGRIADQRTIEYAGGNGVQNIVVKNYFPSGKYELILSDKTFNYHTNLLKK